MIFIPCNILFFIIVRKPFVNEKRLLCGNLFLSVLLYLIFFHQNLRHRVVQKKDCSSVAILFLEIEMMAGCVVQILVARNAVAAAAPHSAVAEVVPDSVAGEPAADDHSRRMAVPFLPADPSPGGLLASVLVRGFR
jgi:hypothetical protein